LKLFHPLSGLTPIVTDVRRWPSMRLHDIRLFGEQTQLQLSRGQWRRDAGPRDDGEWVGMWTLCVSSPKEARTQSALVPFTLAAFLSRCVSPVACQYLRALGGSYVLFIAQYFVVLH
jgi:hypothetical protein